mgnify:CR=1 FL=1
MRISYGEYDRRLEIEDLISDYIDEMREEYLNDLAIFQEEWLSDNIDLEIHETFKEEVF